MDARRPGRDGARSRALLEFSHRLAASMDDVRGLLDEVVSLVSRFLGDTAVLRLLDQSGDSLSLVAVGDTDASVRAAIESIVESSPARLDAIEPWAQAIHLSRRIVLFGDELAAATAVFPRSARLAIRQMGIRATLICPLTARGQVIGTLGLWRRAGAPHSERDQAFVQDLADRTALAIDNARLVEHLRAEIEERRRHEESLSLSAELLQRAEAKRRELLANLVSAEEEQRRRIALDVHDDSIQAMAAIGLRIQVLRRHAPSADFAGQVSEIEEAVMSSIKRLRHLLFQLETPAVDEGGLARALSRYLEETFRDAVPAISFTNRLDCDPPQQLGVLLYRIAQEAINNVRKHACATRVAVTLSSDGEGVLVVIEDDGLGFDMDETSMRALPGHLGLRSMYERAAMAEGTLAVDSVRGTGTTVRLWLPLRDPFAEV